MANSFYFQPARALIAVSDSRHLQAIRSNLYILGFRETVWVSDMTGLVDNLKAHQPDLLLVDTELTGGPPFALITSLRQGQLPANPFMGVIAVTGHATEHTVRQTIDCGADDIITMPWPEAYLDSRLTALVTDRRPFVVTSDYIGPDRRRNPRRGAPETVLAPPNPLRIKVLERGDNDDIKRRSSDAMRQMKIHRLMAKARLMAFLLGELDRMTPEALITHQGPGDLVEQLHNGMEQLVDLATGSRFNGALSGCHRILREINLIRDARRRGQVPSREGLPALRQRLIRDFEMPEAEDSPSKPPLPRAAE